MSDEGNWMEGGCLCGAVRFAIDRSAVVTAAHCHCTDCQRSTGCAFATFCFVPLPGFRTDAGEPKSFTVQGTSGQDVTRFFCGDCGSPLFSEVAVAPGARFVKTGSLDDASWVEPQAVYWCDTAQPWAPAMGELTEHARNPD